MSIRAGVDVNKEEIFVEMSNNGVSTTATLPLATATLLAETLLASVEAVQASQAASEQD